MNRSPLTVVALLITSLVVGTSAFGQEQKGGDGGAASHEATTNDALSTEAAPADAVSSDAASKGPADEPTAADVEGAPGPERDVTGIEGGQPGVPASLWIPRVLLYPVRGALEVSMAPLRGLIYVDQKYLLRERIREFFFTDDHRFGIYPTAFIETGFGLNVGARLVWKDMMGPGTRIRLRAGYGGQFRRLFEGTVKIPAGKRVELKGSGLIENRSRDRFFGLGMADTVDFEALPMTGLDALDLGAPAVDTRFSEELTRVGLHGLVRLGGPFHIALDSFYIRRRYGPAEDTAFSTGGATISVDQAFDTATIPGFDDGVDYVYNELEIAMDTRTTGTRFSSDPIPGTGWYFELYGGHAASVKGKTTSFMRYGIDAQRYFRIAQNPRTLVVRAHLEGVTGAIEDIPFTELPRLGGPLLLRGNYRDRYRDRVRALATAEYEWDLTENFAAFVFLDGGEVFRRYQDASLSDVALGFGGGLQMHTRSSYYGRFMIAGSPEGDIFFNLVVDPAFDIRSRTLVK